MGCRLSTRHVADLYMYEACRRDSIFQMLEPGGIFRNFPQKTQTNNANLILITTEKLFGLNSPVFPQVS